MPVLSVQEIYQDARDAGFDPHQAVTWTAIALAESGGRTNALADHGEHSEGLWQINVAGGVRANTFGNLYDPKVNARAAYQISDHGTDMRPWSTTHNSSKGTAHDYRRYLPEVEKEIGVQGDGRGVADYGSPLPPPLFGTHAATSDHDTTDAASSHDSTSAHDPSAQETPTPDSAQETGGHSSAAGDNPTGQPVGAGVDSDHDGLTDAFEKMIGTNPYSADTDGDGLSDGYEVVVSHTNPLSADTDHDGVSDAVELATGTDPGHIPGIGGIEGSGPLAYNAEDPGKDSDHDGIPDRIEKLIGTNPYSADTDHDGLSDSEEIALGTDPTDADSDHDGLTDGFEVQNHLNPLGATGSQTDTVAEWTMESALASRAGAQTTTHPSQSAPTTDNESGALHTFLGAAEAQAGDSYVYGATPKLSNPNPTAFDCSSLTQWAAAQAGVKLPRIAEDQYMDLKAEHDLIPVSQALKTPGALLFYFSEEPTGPLPPGQAHVAISLGNGKTIEAKGTAYGVGEFSAKGRFNYAAVIPGISDGTGGPAAATTTADDFAIDTPAALTDPSDADTSATSDAADPPADTQVGTVDDGLADAFEKLAGTSPTSVDSDHDGLSDREEELLGTNPYAADSDHDGLSDATEVALGTDPLSADTDHDGISDSLEVHDHFNPLVADVFAPGEFGPEPPPDGPASEVETILDH